MRSVLCTLFLISLGTTAAAQDAAVPAPEHEKPQNSITYRQIEDLPLRHRRNFRPKLSLQKALKIAEEYIEKEKIDIVPYYLYQAKFTLYGSPGKQEPCWHFWWVKETGALGDYVELIVNIDSGKVRRVPSM